MNMPTRHDASFRRGALLALSIALAGCQVVDGEASVEAARKSCGLPEGAARWARPDEPQSIIFAVGLSQEQIACVFRETKKFPLGSSQRQPAPAK